MTAVNTVMNCSDLVGEIFSFAFQPKPNKCDVCKVYTTDLHLWKKVEGETKFVSPNGIFYSVAEIKDILEFNNPVRNLDILNGISIESKYEEKNCWKCSSCFCSNLGVLDPNSITHKTIQKKLEEENPERENRKIWTALRRELRLIIENKLLFQTHRIKKTQEKAKLYENLVYQDLKRKVVSVFESGKFDIKYKEKRLELEKEYQRNTIKKICKERSEKFLREIKAKQDKKIRKLRDLSNEWVKEIRMRKIAKLYFQKKIPHSFYYYITSQMYCCYPFPTWEEFAKRYTNYSSNPDFKCSPLPEWWYSL